METVCDDYHGAAFGLCNAYCEAMDCDDPRVHASARACERVGTRFTRLTHDQLPCEDVDPVCHVVARDDTVEAPSSEEIYVTFDVLANDSPQDGSLFVASHNAPGDFTLVDPGTGLPTAGTFNGTIIDETEFVYEACNEECCDEATVFLRLPDPPPE